MGRKQEMRKARAEAYRERTALRQVMAAQGVKRRERATFRQQEMRKGPESWLAHLPETDYQAFRISLRATRSLLPRKAVVELHPLRSNIAEATTRGVRGKVHIDYDPTAASGRRDRRLGQVTATLTHELAVHGKNVARRKDVDPDQEHRDMFHPSGRKEYLTAARQAFNALENPAQKRAFVNSWASDMRMYLSRDVGIYNAASDQNERRIGKGEKRAMHDWITQQRRNFIGAIAHPEKYDWTRR